jgi:hypothetical protein
VVTRISPTAHMTAFARRKIPIVGRLTGARRPSTQTYPQSVLSQYQAPIYIRSPMFGGIYRKGFAIPSRAPEYFDANGKSMLPSTYQQWLREGGAAAVPFKGSGHQSPPIIAYPTPIKITDPLRPSSGWSAIQEAARLAVERSEAIRVANENANLVPTPSSPITRVDGLGRMSVQEYLRSNLRSRTRFGGGVRGLGAAPAAVEASAAVLAPPGSVILSPDLAIDWKGGNIYYQKMKLGIIASLLTGMVVKGIMFGGGKVSSAVRSRFGKKATA